MIRKYNLIALFVAVFRLVFTSDDLTKDDGNLTTTTMFNCSEILTRKYGSTSGYRKEIFRMVSKCPVDYEANSAVKLKCETEARPSDITNDVFLFTLALDHGSRSKLYLNVYCAICHGQKEFYQFPPHLYYELDEASRSAAVGGTSVDEDRKYYAISKHPVLLSNLIGNNTTNELTSFDMETGWKYTFKPYRVLVVPVRSSGVYHEPMLLSRPANLPICEELPVNVSSINFTCTQRTKIEDCHYHDSNHSNIFNLRDTIELLNRYPNGFSNAVYCPEKYFDSNGESSRCKYKDDKAGHMCWLNKFLTKGVDYAQGENGEIFFVENYLMMNISRNEYSSQTGLENVIFLCAANEYEAVKNRYCIEIINSIQTLLRRVSIFCVFVYLIIKGRRKSMPNLAEKIAYSYYLTLLLMYCREEIGEGLKFDTCFLNYSAYRYLLQSYSFWIAIAAWYIRVVTKSPGAERTMNENVMKSRLIYLAMCLVGWLLPAIFTAIFYLFEPITSCPTVRGYVHLKMCKMPDEHDAYFWFIFTSMCIIFALVLAQFVSSCCYYRRHGTLIDQLFAGEFAYSDWRIRTMFFFKIVYSIGLYATLMIASLIDRHGALYKILLHLWCFHGTLIFFFYSFNVTVLQSMLKERRVLEGAQRTDMALPSMPVRRFNGRNFKENGLSGCGTI